MGIAVDSMDVVEFLGSGGSGSAGAGAGAGAAATDFPVPELDSIGMQTTYRCELSAPRLLVCVMK